MADAPFDIRVAHRWFAVELNNLAWDLVETKDRSQQDTQRMIDAAHAACFHWLQVGTSLNHQRAQCLSASAYAAAGCAEAAMRHAQHCLKLSEENGATQTAFDRATAHGCAASALALAGQMDEAQEHHRLAREVAAACDHPDEPEVFARLYPAL